MKGWSGEIDVVSSSKSTTKQLCERIVNCAYKYLLGLLSGGDIPAAGRVDPAVEVDHRELVKWFWDERKLELWELMAWQYGLNNYNIKSRGFRRA